MSHPWKVKELMGWPNIWILDSWIIWIWLCWLVWPCLSNKPFIEYFHDECWLSWIDKRYLLCKIIIWRKRLAINQRIECWLSDIDECQTNPCNGACVNLPGSYQCICDPGYELRDGRCQGIVFFITPITNIMLWKKILKRKINKENCKWMDGALLSY